MRPYVVESVSAARMADLAAVLEDPNPIHLDRDLVQRLGMGEREINQGPATCSYVVNLLRAAFPDATITRLSFRLLGNVFAGDRAIAGGEILERTPDEVRCAVWLDVEGRGRMVDGTATIRPNTR
jgi:3-hydroxybutyryl-CoA dehydratase